MSATRLDTPFLDGGIHATNFFNGRILSSEDMLRDREARRVVDERLARAVGDGIVSGFEVEAKAIGGSSLQNPVVTVHAGLALNRRGDTLALDRDVDVALLKPTSPSASVPSTVGAFGVCAPPDNSVYVTGTGVYLLTVAPASARQGLAPVSGLANGIASCNAKEIVSGVQFRLSRVTSLSNAELADEAHLRNVAAYRFLTTAGIGVGGVVDPFGVVPAASLTAPAPTECEVPLALIHWTATGGVRWVDLWSVRRRVTPIPSPEPFGNAASYRRTQVGEAALFQFQEEAAELVASGAPDQIRATDTFRFLPAAAALPFVGLGASTGFDRLKFFEARPTRGAIVLEGAEVPALLRASLAAPPIDLSDRVLIWIYLVRENLQASGTSAAPYFLFASGQLPPLGAARFDVARAGFANVAVL